MTPIAVVSDASVLIALNDVGLLDHIVPVFSACVIPPVVEREIAPSVRRPEWITVRALSRPIDSRVLRVALDAGETEVLSLALELGQHYVAVDERSARSVAVSLRLPIIGTLGILVLAKEAALLPMVRPYLDELRETGFFISEPLFEHVLTLAGEHA